MQISVGGRQRNAVFQKPGGSIQKREPECFGIGKGCGMSRTTVYKYIGLLEANRNGAG